jgi:hypothetical protein
MMDHDRKLEIYQGTQDDQRAHHVLSSSTARVSAYGCLQVWAEERFGDTAWIDAGD